MDLEKIKGAETFKEFRYFFLQWCQDEIFPLEDVVDEMYRLVRKQEQEIAALKGHLRRQKIAGTLSALNEEEDIQPEDENRVIISS